MTTAREGAPTTNIPCFVRLFDGYPALTPLRRVEVVLP